MQFLVGILAVIMYSLWIMESLKRNGFHLASFNPFSAIHRYRWRQKLNVNPLYNLTDPRDIVTVLLISLIKSTGEITNEQKQIVLNSLRQQFQFTEEEAAHFFAHCSFMMRNTVDILAITDKVIASLIGQCTPEQINSVRKMLRDVATEEGKTSPNAYQQSLIDRVMQLIDPPRPSL